LVLGGKAWSRKSLREPQYIIRSMRRRVARAAVLLAFGLTAACSNPLGKQYEYEEQLYLSVNGAATMAIDTSVPALVALHHVPLDPAPRARLDREDVRKIFLSSQCSDVRVGQPWIRKGRRFVQIRIAVPDVRQLRACGPLGWSAYSLTREASELHFEQTVGPPNQGDPGKVNWDGTELVAFKLHLPSRILFHNVKRLEDGSNGEAERGNIWRGNNDWPIDGRVSPSGWKCEWLANPSSIERCGSLAVRFSRPWPC
jgi:hypothetical protein